MTLPILRPAFLRSFAALPGVRHGLERQLMGGVIVLPPMLRAEEHEAILDLLAFFLDLPIRMARSMAEVTAGAVWVLVEPVGEPPRGVAGAIVVGERRRVPGERHLDLGPEVLLLRDALCECLGREWSGTRLQRVAAWVGEATDSPGTAMRFADAAMALHAREPEASDADLFLAGLAAAAGWLLRGADEDVAAWALRMALRVEGRHGALSRLLWGEPAGDEHIRRRRFFAAGLVHGLPDEQGGPIDLRRPLELLRSCEGAPFRFSSQDLAARLGPEVQQQARLVLDEYVMATVQPLRLSRPEFEALGGPVDLPVATRLSDLCQPADEVTITILWDPESTREMHRAAAAVSMSLEPKLETVWITFAGGPERGFRPVAAALDIDTEQPEATTPDQEGVPRWVGRAHDYLRMRPCLLVVEDADAVPEADLGKWLPAGPGRCVVLVLSRRPERVLQRTRDAIAVHFDPTQEG